METKNYEVVKCECGHECPIDFAIIDEDANYTCPNCHIGHLNEIIAARGQNLLTRAKHCLYLMLAAVISFLNLKFNVTQYKWGRRLYGGKYYLIKTDLRMNTFWAETQITSCGGKTIKQESYNCR